MERTQKSLTMADVAGIGSALVTFGLIQGALYLKAYWGHFGLDPFQFAAVGELALAGLAGIGMVLFLLLISLLFGGWIQSKLDNRRSNKGMLSWLAPTLFFAGLGALIWWANAWPVLIGLLLTIVCALVVQLSPVVPRSVKNSPWLIYFMVMIVYVSIVSNWLGSERAEAIAFGRSKYTAAVSTDGDAQRGLTLIGRLGDCYVLWNPVQKAATIVPVSDVKVLEIAQIGAARAPEAK
ncbi:hypothetical protein [Stenotrophomonas sp.]|uniref:hypothetical protein n=1 Tax=Stenotrophomonas sp. TaxID=69392 RepID=UPI0028A15461|nr:hypothetical protein [Stenotrophomonas sp.]